MSDVKEIKKRKKTNKSLNKIVFDAETVPRDVAEHNLQITRQAEESKIMKDSKKKKNKFKDVEENVMPRVKKSKKKQIEEPPSTDLNPKPKKKKRSAAIEPTIPTGEADSKEESIRSKKRKKHQQLLQTKKLKVDLVMQEKSLNYLSRWKHSRGEWKFEKLRQIWLQQNMFDPDRMPAMFWETALEYFSNAKGTIKKTILDTAIKIVDECEISESKQDETKEEVENDDDNNIKIERARNIIQCLQD